MTGPMIGASTRGWRIGATAGLAGAGARGGATGDGGFVFFSFPEPEGEG